MRDAGRYGLVHTGTEQSGAAEHRRASRSIAEQSRVDESRPEQGLRERVLRSRAEPSEVPRSRAGAERTPKRSPGRIRVPVSHDGDRRVVCRRTTLPAALALDRVTLARGVLEHFLRPASVSRVAPPSSAEVVRRDRSAIRAQPKSAQLGDAAAADELPMRRAARAEYCVVGSDVDERSQVRGRVAGARQPKRLPLGSLGRVERRQSSTPLPASCAGARRASVETGERQLQHVGSLAASRGTRGLERRIPRPPSPRRSRYSDWYALDEFKLIGPTKRGL